MAMESNNSLRNRHAFIDEFGNSDLDTRKSGVSSHFILVAVLFERDSLDTECDKLERIRRTHFQSGEIKSSKVGANHDRRIRILRDLAIINFRAYAYVVDKAQLYSVGLRYKQVFYKFLNGQLDADLYSTFPDLKVTADDLGSEEFRQSFIQYVRNRHIPDLFDQSDFGFVPSTGSVFLQVADFIAGTLARRFDRTCFTRRHDEFMEVIGPRISAVVEWPLQSERVQVQVQDSNLTSYDPEIAQAAIQNAEYYIGKHERSRDTLARLRVATLKYLLFNFLHVDSERFITADEMVESVSFYSGEPVSRQVFMQQIIAKLRDSGVVLASGNKGYKIPGSARDLDSYVAHTQTVVIPMLKRLRNTRNKVFLATEGNHDILGSRDLLRSMVDSMESNPPWVADEVTPEDVST